MTKCIILSGISGSGKSTYASSVCSSASSEGKTAKICSADNYFIRDGKYQFDASRLGDAHAFCFSEYLKALSEGIEVIVVDNTNTRVEHISPYMLAAAAYGIQAEIVTLECDPDIAARRNQHGLSGHSVKSQLRSLQKRNLMRDWKNTVVKAYA